LRLTPFFNFRSRNPTSPNGQRTPRKRPQLHHQRRRLRLKTRSQPKRLHLQPKSQRRKRARMKVCQFNVWISLYLKEERNVGDFEKDIVMGKSPICLFFLKLLS
jgi:hypothetical protein